MGRLRRSRTFVGLLDAGVPAHVGAPPPRRSRLLHVRRQPPLHRWGRGNGEPAEIQGVRGRNPGLHKHGERGTDMRCFGAFDWMVGNRWEELNLTRYQNRRRELICADAFDRSHPHHKTSVYFSLQNIAQFENFVAIFFRKEFTPKKFLPLLNFNLSKKIRVKQTIGGKQYL